MFPWTCLDGNSSSPELLRKVLVHCQDNHLQEQEGTQTRSVCLQSFLLVPTFSYLKTCRLKMHSWLLGRPSFCCLVMKISLKCGSRSHFGMTNSVRFWLQLKSLSGLSFLPCPGNTVQNSMLIQDGHILSCCVGAGY